MAITGLSILRLGEVQAYLCHPYCGWKVGGGILEIDSYCNKITGECEMCGTKWPYLHRSIKVGNGCFLCDTMCIHCEHRGNYSMYCLACDEELSIWIDGRCHECKSNESFDYVTRRCYLEDRNLHCKRGHRTADGILQCVECNTLSSFDPNNECKLIPAETHCEKTMTLLQETVAHVSLPTIGTRLPVLANLAQITATAAQERARMSAQVARMDTTRSQQTT